MIPLAIKDPRRWAVGPDGDITEICFPWGPKAIATDRWTSMTPTFVKNPGDLDHWSMPQDSLDIVLQGVEQISRITARVP